MNSNKTNSLEWFDILCKFLYWILHLVLNISSLFQSTSQRHFGSSVSDSTLFLSETFLFWLRWRCSSKKRKYSINRLFSYHFKRHVHYLRLTSSSSIDSARWSLSWCSCGWSWPAVSSAWTSMHKNVMSNRTERYTIGFMMIFLYILMDFQRK